MTATTSSVTRPATQKSRQDLKVIDCDVHNEFRDFRQDVLPYLDPEWKHYITNRGFNGISMRPYTLWQGRDRRDTWMPDGTRGSAHWQVLYDQHLEAWDLEYVVMTGSSSALSVCWLAQHEWATALAKAVNDWAIENWYEKDPRIKGSILVAAQRPEAAAREIDRCGAHPDVVQVILPTRSPGGIAWSDEKYDPIWAAAERNDLVVGFHLNADGGNVPPPLGPMPRLQCRRGALSGDLAVRRHREPANRRCRAGQAVTRPASLHQVLRRIHHFSTDV